MKQNFKRGIATLMAILMLFSLAPVSAFANEGQETGHVHEWDGGNVVAEANCTEAGSIEYRCACGESKTENIPAKGHAWGDWTVTKAPTCAETGSREHTCAVCNVTESEEIAALGHTWGDWTVTREAACADSGSREHTCSVCGVTVSEEIAAPGHAWGDWTVIKEATCAEPGSREHTCSVCNVTESEVTTVDHTWGDWTVTKEAACAEAGSREHTCSVCNTVESEEIAAPGHAWGEWTVIKEATCAEPGSREHTCSVCNVTESEVTTVDHTWGKWTVTEEATCTEAGSRYHTCSVCDTVESEEIPALGHKWGKWTITEEPACTETGSREHTCSVCELTEVEELAALGHSWGDWTVTKEATKSEKGWRERTCSACEVVEGEEIPVLPPDEYAVVFKDGEKVVAEVKVTEDTAIGDKLPQAPEKDAAYLFEGWFDEAGSAVTADTVVTGPMTVLARFKYYPAGSGSASSGNVTVGASWEAGVFPEGTQLTVSALGSEKALDMALRAGIDAVDGEAADITFLAPGGGSVQPLDGKAVSISMSLSRALDGDTFTVLHENSAPMRRRLMKAASAGGSVEVIGAAANANGSYFSSGSFSVYAVVGEDAKTRIKVNFQDVPGATQIVKAGDTLNKPDPDPADPTGEGEFTGWKLGTQPFDDSYFGAPPLTDEQIAAIVALSGQTPGDDNHHLIEITLSPVFSTTLTVRFWTDDTKAERTDTRLVYSGDALSLTGINYVVPVGYNLAGWTDGTTTYTDKIDPVTADMDLWPVLVEGHVVRFETNGGTLIAPQYVAPGGHASAPDPAPEKTGYDFAGWYGDDALTDPPFDFANTAINEDRLLYAKWTPATSPFTVVYYVQHADDDGYDFYTSRERTGPTEGNLDFMLDTTETSYIDTTFRRLSSGVGIYCTTYFVNETKLADAKTAAGQIKPDGSTVLNVYMDRVWYYLTIGSDSTVYTVRWGEYILDKIKSVWPESEHPTWYQTISATQCWGLYLTANGSNIGGFPNFFHGGTVMTPEAMASYGKFEVPMGATLQLKNPYNAAGPYVYHVFSFEEKLDSTQSYDSPFTPDWDNFVPKMSTMSYSVSNYHTGVSDNEQWRSAKLEYYSSGSASYQAYVNKDNPDTWRLDLHPDYDGSYSYRYYINWKVRQRYDLKFVCLPDDSSNVLREDLMWGTPLASYVPAGYDSNKTMIIDGVKHRFAGWYADSSRQYQPWDPTADDAVMPWKNLELYAKWEPVVYDAIVHFNNGGATPDYEQIVTYGTVLDEPSVEYSGHTLAGWYTTPTFDPGSEFFFGAGGTAITDYVTDENGVINVYARWITPGVTYTVKYMPDDDPEDKTVYADGSQITLKGAPGTIPSGYRFIGWTLTETPVPSAKKLRSDPTPISGTIAANAENAAVVVIPEKEYQIELYPLFASESQPQVTLTYHANYPPNGPDPTEPDSPVAVNGEVTILSLAAAGFSAPTGYQFAGWNAAADGSGAGYEAGQPYAIDTDSDIYAIWAPILTVELTGSEKTVPYNGKEQSNTEYTVTYKFAGQTITTLPSGVVATLTATQDGNPVDPIVAKGTDVGTYTVHLKLTLSKASGSTTIVILPDSPAEADVVLKIKPIPLTVTSASASKVYDGLPLTKKDGYTVDGLVNGEKITVNITGSQTDVGSSSNTFTITWDTAKPSNYELHTYYGLLEVTEEIDDDDVPLAGFGGSNQVGEYFE